jgi:hypothetical protein
MAVTGGCSPELGRAVVPAREWPEVLRARTMRRMLRRTIALVAILLLTAGPAAAGTIVVTLTFVPGKLVVRAPAATLSASASVRVPISLADGRGNGKGWTLRVASGQAVTVTSISARCAAGSTCTLPTAAHGPSGSLVLQAAGGTGMGVMNLVVTLAPLAAGSPPTEISFAAA